MEYVIPTISVSLRLYETAGAASLPPPTLALHQPGWYLHKKQVLLSPCPSWPGTLPYGGKCSYSQCCPGRGGRGVPSAKKSDRGEGVSLAPPCLVMALPLTAQYICSHFRTIFCRVTPHHFSDSTNRKHVHRTCLIATDP